MFPFLLLPCCEESSYIKGLKPTGVHQSRMGAKLKSARGQCPSCLGAESLHGGLMAELIGKKAVRGRDE